MPDLINLTPHAMHLYAPDCPARINPDEHDAIRVIEPSGTIARLGATELGDWHLDGIAVVQVDFCGTTGLPPYAGHMDSRDRETWYLVSLVTALAAPERGDLLVPFADVRNGSGQVVGCRAFARPV